MSKEKAVAKQMKKVAQKNQIAFTAAQKALDRVEQAEMLQSGATDQLVEAQVKFLGFFVAFLLSVLQFCLSSSASKCNSIKENYCIYTNFILP